MYNGTVMPICDNKKRCHLGEFNNIIEYQNVKNYDEECYLVYYMLIRQNPLKRD